MKTGLIIIAAIIVIGLISYYFYSEHAKNKAADREAAEKIEKELQEAAEAKAAEQAKAEEDAIAEAKAERAREKQKAYRKRRKAKKLEEAKKLEAEKETIKAPAKRGRKPKTSK